MVSRRCAAPRQPVESAATALSEARISSGRARAVTCCATSGQGTAEFTVMGFGHAVMPTDAHPQRACGKRLGGTRRAQLLMHGDRRLRGALGRRGAPHHLVADGPFEAPAMGLRDVGQEPQAAQRCRAARPHRQTAP